MAISQDEFVGPPNCIGALRNRGFDAKRYQRLERLDAIADCPRCGKEVECWSDTEEWVEDARLPCPRRWLHSEFGGAMGVCEDCHLLIADCLSNGFKVFKLEGAK